jgi:hypothetical protein
MKSIVIDNFFEDPYKIIELSEKQTYYKRGPDQYYEGIRTANLKDLDFNFYNKTVSKIVYSYFETNFQYKIEGHLNFHRLRKEDLEDPHWKYDRVHQDNCVTSSIVYLTPDAPMSSGTQLYRQQGDKFTPDVVYNNKFNRMIMFPGEVHHSAIDIDGGSSDRLTLLFFLEKIEKIT